MTPFILNPEQQLTQHSQQPAKCRSCRFYEFQGRREGYCHQLEVPISSNLPSCRLALPPFTPS